MQKNGFYNPVFLFCPKCSSKSLRPHGPQGYRCGACEFEFFLNVAAAAAGLIINSKNELLVCVRAKEPAKGTLDLPGGFIDPDETAEQAICREIKEELNLDVVGCTYFCSIPNQYPYMGVVYRTLDLAFVCKITDFTPLKAMDDVKDCSFIPIDRLDLALFGFESVRQIIGRFAQSLQTKPA
jgi:mutator protein MutT